MIDLDALCHRCGTTLPATTDRHPLCARCRSDRKAGRQRLSSRCSRQRRRAYRAGAAGSFFSADVRALWSRQRGKCNGCGRRLGSLYASPPGYHLDHKTALANGGENSVDNIQLLCVTCNLEKGDR